MYKEEQECCDGTNIHKRHISKNCTQTFKMRGIELEYKKLKALPFNFLASPCATKI
jgi:hypothetical protein